MHNLTCCVSPPDKLTNQPLLVYYKVILKSGNTFYFAESTLTTVALAYILSPTRVFLGGMAGYEAKRKFDTFSDMEEAIQINEDEFQLIDVDFDDFASKLGAMSSYFLSKKDVMINDFYYCNGTSSFASSCDERYHYYKTVGLEGMFKTQNECPMWAFIANHVAFFGVKNFKDTFFRGCDSRIEKDMSMSNVFNTRYYDGTFKAPAYYVRSLCQSV